MDQQPIAASAGQHDTRPGPPRVIHRETSDRVVIGLPAPWAGDLYHYLVALPWTGFLAGLSSVYLILNCLFALLYLLGDSAILNARPGAFSDAFFFSVETLSTIGYGQMSPANLYTTSPLYNASASSVAAEGAELVVTVSGIDETTSQIVHARTSYLAHEILWDHRFADVFTQTADGRLAIDYRRFHDTGPAQSQSA